MPDTGTLSFNTTQELAENISNGDNILAGSSVSTFGIDDNGILLVTDAGDDNLPAGSTVTALTFYITGYYSSFGAATDAYLYATIDGGSNYSALGKADLTNSSATHTVTQPLYGGGTTWGLDWTGFTDLNQLGVKITSQAGLFDTNSTTYFSLIQAKIDYTLPAINGKMTLNSGKLTLTGGKIKL